MPPALLDTDILNEVLKQKHPTVVRHAADYLAQHGTLAFSSITRYEVVRGLREKAATAQLTRFDSFCRHAVLVPVIDEILDRAADLWVEGRRTGMSPNDADLIIAATALHHARTLVTGNTRHFQWIPGLALADWRST